jgi:hypothetical protein
MVILSQFKNKTLELLEGEPVESVHRPYLGMSKINHSCTRYLWYSFRWCYSNSFGGRQRRLFARGHREEPEIVKELEKIGIRCYDDQAGIVLAHGHGKGHIDGKCIGVPEAPLTEHLSEFKTMNDKNFKLMKKDHLEKSKPVYYGQCQIYMRKMKLTRTLFIAVNKNTDEMYIERVKLDKGFADDLERRAEFIVLSEDPPAKEFKPTWYECKWCDANSICHGKTQVQKNCRTCENVVLEQEGKWSCLAHVIMLSTEQQRNPCKFYSMLHCLRK